MSLQSSLVPMDVEADAAEYQRLVCGYCGRDVGMFGTTFPCDYCNEYAVPVDAAEVDR